MQEIKCKYCGSRTKNTSNICSKCYGKLRLIRRIKEMLGGENEQQEKGL